MAEINKGKRQPGDDIPIGTGEQGQDTLLNVVRAYKKEAIDARRTRMHKNKQNRQAYLSVQDWSHKVKGQSQEFLPKTAVAVEQFVSFAKKALTRFGAYYEVELGRDSKSPLSGTGIRKLIDCHINNMLIEDNVVSSFPILMSNALKVGALESLMIIKVHGNMTKTRKFREGEDGELKPEDFEHWQLRADLIRPEDYLPDPTGAGLYEIHTSKRDLSYLVDRAEEGVYDKDVVKLIKEDFDREMANDEQTRRPHDMAQDQSIKPGFRKKVQIDEFWGTIVDSDGRALHRNIFCAIANDKWVIKKPTPNPFWHQESPFVVVPLIRVPFSVWHKAMFDDAAQLNFAMNELFNLIIDGGVSAVWGIKQLRVDDLEDPRAYADGIPQGETILVKNSLPHGAKALETVTEGKVPNDSMAVLEMLSREHAASALSNELKLGSLPAKQVKATEITELSQSQAITMDGIIADIERECIQKFLRKAWLTTLQNMDDITSSSVVAAVGIKGAFALSQMTPAQRYQVFADDCSFNVFGLSEVLAKTRDFQKLMALIQAISSVPMLMQAFFTKYSPAKVLSNMIKMLGINPEQMHRDEDELNRLGQELIGLEAFTQLAQGQSGQTGGGLPGEGQTTQSGSSVSAQNTGSESLPAEIASVGNPTAGLAGVGNS